MEKQLKTAEEVLNFWFDPEIQPFWFVKSEHFDTVCRRFEATLIAAAAGECVAWRKTMEGRLAEIIVLDQFSRNLFRDSPQAFRQDAMALALAQEAVKHPDYTALEPVKRKFILMPYMHSESKLIHRQAVPLFEALGLATSLDFELRHKAIVDQFGRYPHRNQILNRESTREEMVFLQQEGSSF